MSPEARTQPSTEVMDIRVIGVPRSGTNLVKYLIESYTEMRCHFHLGWWKHAVVPALMNGTNIVEDNIPTIVTFRDPLVQMASFFKFTSNGGWAIEGSSDFGEFVLKPCTLNANRSISYRYSSPIDYWRQFYFAALNWKNEKKWFVELERLQETPDTILPVLRELLGDTLAPGSIRLPSGYLRRNIDTHIEQLDPTEDTTSVSEESDKVRALVDSLASGTSAWIYGAETTEILSELRSRGVKYDPDQSPSHH